MSTRAGAALALLAALAAAPVRADEPGKLLVYPSHGRPDAFVVTGRFIEDEGVGPGSRTTSTWRNVVANLRRLESDEIEDARLEVEVAGRRFTTTTDDDGVWQIRVPEVKPPLTPGVVEVRVRALDDRGHPAPPATGPLYILPDGPAVAVISDFDDTVVRSGITSKRELVATALGKNATQLEPVGGAPAAYRAAIEAGAAAVFYLTGSPQNFMDRILHYLSRHGFPPGPVLLKNFGEDPTLDQERYKLGRIQTLLDMHPKLRFVLVGDSGELDPEIYARVRGQYPDRIAGIIIRRAPGGDADPARFRGLTLVDDFGRESEVLRAAVRAAAGAP